MNFLHGADSLVRNGWLFDVSDLSHTLQNIIFLIAFVHIVLYSIVYIYLK